VANDFYTVADAVADALDLSPEEISDLIDEAAFMMALPMIESSNGETHKYAKETGAPVVGFRAENAGRDFDSSADTVVSVLLKILDFSWMVDKAVADRWRKGKENFISREGFRHLKAAMFALESQYFQGTGADAAGFAGFPDATGLDALADTMVINSGGTAADAVTSCYLIRLGQDAVGGVMIPDSPFELGDTIVQNFVDGSSKNLPVYYTPGCTWAGLQIGGAYDVARICNIDPTGATGTFDDDKVIEAIESFPKGEPSVIVMNRSARKLLRESRTATNTTGAPAPRPTEVEGIPILKTEALINTEALVA